MFLNYFSMEKCDVGWSDFLKFSELFFNGEMWRHEVMWHAPWIFRIIFNREVMWHEVIFLNFYNYFSIEKGDMACYLNFQNYFSMEKGDVAWADFLEFLELFFNGERWRGMLLEFSEIFFNGERWHDLRWCVILTCWENWN
jgi:hypothetical protein